MTSGAFVLVVVVGDLPDQQWCPIGDTVGGRGGGVEQPRSVVVRVVERRRHSDGATDGCGCGRRRCHRRRRHSHRSAVRLSSPSPIGIAATSVRAVADFLSVDSGSGFVRPRRYGWQRQSRRVGDRHLRSVTWHVHANRGTLNGNVWHVGRRVQQGRRCHRPVRHRWVGKENETKYTGKRTRRPTVSNGGSSLIAAVAERALDRPRNND